MDEHQPFEDLGTEGAPPTAEALRQIVARHQRARTRTLGIVLAIALVAGPLAGWAVGHSGGDGQQVATASKPESASDAQATKNAAVAGGGMGQGFAINSGNPPNAKRLFTRASSDGIAIRAYRVDPPPPANASSTTTAPSAKTQQPPCPTPMPGKPGLVPPGAGVVESGSAASSASSGASSSANASSPGSPPADGAPVTAIAGTPPPCAPLPPDCKPTPAVLAELSTDAAVGQGFDPIDEKQPTEVLSHLSVGMFGVAESAPAMFVTVQTGPGVAAVRLRLPSGATDQMAPSDGVAVLAHASPAPPPDGTVVEALDAAGKVIGSVDVGKQQQGPRTVVACAFASSGSTAVATATAPAPATPPTTR